MLPTRQSLDADELTIRSRQDRLIQQLQFVVLDRRAQFILGALPHPQFLAHLGFEEGKAGTSGLLGSIEREIGEAHQFLAVAGVLRAERNADGNTDENLLVADLERRTHRIENALRQARAVARLD